MKPQPVNDVLLAFPGNVEHLLPAKDDIPKEFWDGNEWTDEASSLFYTGAFKSDRIINSTIKPDFNDVVENIPRHVKAILGTFSIQHEYKIAAIGYLLSLWLDPAG